MLLPDLQTTQAVAIGAAGGAVLVLLIAVFLAFRLRRLRRDYRSLLGDSEHDDLIGLLAEQRAEMREIRGELAGVREENNRLRHDVSDAVRHVAVVRYDAFAEMGGRLSFSAALLDDAGDGLVITSINGRSETRTYAKGIKNCSSSSVISPEEAKAIEHAFRSAQPKRKPSPGPQQDTEVNLDGSEVESVTLRPAPSRP